MWGITSIDHSTFSYITNVSFIWVARPVEYQVDFPRSRRGSFASAFSLFSLSLGYQHIQLHVTRLIKVLRYPIYPNSINSPFQQTDRSVIMKTAIIISGLLSAFAAAQQDQDAIAASVSAQVASIASGVIASATATSNPTMNAEELASYNSVQLASATAAMVRLTKKDFRSEPIVLTSISCQGAQSSIIDAAVSSVYVLSTYPNV